MSTHKIISSLLLGLLLVPLSVMATTTATTTTGSSSPTLTPAGVAEVMSTEKREHGRLSFDLGMPKRISSSPVGLVDLDIAPEVVFNRQLLELYVRKLMLTTTIQELSIAEDLVRVTIASPARLLGVVPVKMSREVAVDIEGNQIDTSVTNKAWWSWLATKLSADHLETQIQTRMSESRYISATQLKAFLIQAVMEAVTN